MKQREYRIRAIGVRLKWVVPPAVLVVSRVSRQKRGSALAKFVLPVAMVDDTFHHRQNRADTSGGTSHQLL